MHQLLIVDNQAEKACQWLPAINRLGHDCRFVDSKEKVLESLVSFKPSLVFMAANGNDHQSFELISLIKDHANAAPIILFSKGKDIDFIVNAVKAGAIHYYECPNTQEELLELLGKITHENKVNHDEKSVVAAPQKSLPGVVGESKASEKVAMRVFKLAPLDVNVMIWGETGTGKELIAQSIHNFSDRANKPFIPIDCVSLPPNLIESEIFGHEQGAFTGALKAKKGLLELADGGTLFLDEITELDIYLQGKLLRVLQERQFRRVGGSKLINVDLRILSATNHDPEQAVAENKLRRDLYYRLNVVPLHLLPLRERKNDIAFLAEHFIQELDKFSRVEVKGMTRRALNALIKYDWPGNVRELQNVILQAVALSESDMIDIGDLPDSLQNKNSAIPVTATDENMNFRQAREQHMRKFCQAYFDEILEKYQGNISEVAREAELSRGTIYKIFKDFDITNPHISA